jgi:hypothetical protein
MEAVRGVTFFRIVRYFYRFNQSCLRYFGHPSILDEMTNLHGIERARQEGVLFGIPLGELGFFQTLLVSFAAAFAAFFLTTFVAIMSLLVYMGMGHRPDFALTYRDAGLPVGLLVLVIALGYLGTQWVKRKVRKG